ncbi:hypothetical protein F5884DRAFT_853737 [Xylogone sp. PMI_703]|nr:hypothetical protein F5884DRAFT_853737 [Xylogone sp. PMI_703]
MVTTDPNELFWLAYFKAIKTKAGGGKSDPTMGKDYFYLASNANRSIPASRYIPMSTTNEYLYNEADNLMKTNDPLYVPGAGNTSYVRALYTYLTHVKPEREPTAEDLTKEKAIFARLGKAEDDMRARARAAKRDYREDIRDDPNMKLDFATWCRTNAKTYLATIQDYDSINSQYILFKTQIYGPNSQIYQADLLKLSQVAKDPTQESHGVTMRCSPEQILDVAEAIEKAQKTGSKDPQVKEPDTFYLRAAYNIDPQYRATMDSWAIEFSQPETDSITLEIDQGNTTSWKEYGFENIKAGGGISVLGLFRIGGSGGSETKDEKVHFDEKKSKVSIQLKWKKLQYFNVTPGTWNIPQIKKTYPKTVGLSPEEEALIRPTQFLCASGLTIISKLEGQVKEEFNKLHEKQVKAGGEGSVRYGIFGFDAGASYDKKDSTQTSTGSWNYEKGELTVSPTPTFGYSTLLGVRCQAVTT